MPEPATTHARQDPAHCLAPGLFRVLRRGDRKRLKLDITYSFGRITIRWWGPEPLDATDLRVLQGLVSLSAIQSLLLPAAPKTEFGRELQAALALSGEQRIRDDAVVVQASYRQLAREIGLDPDSGSSYRAIRASIARLFAVSIIVTNGKREDGYRLLAAVSQEGPGFTVALNPRIAVAVMGGRHTRVPMDEVRVLESDAARVLHQRLCALVDPGKTRNFRIDTLCAYIWPEHESMSGPAQRQHRHRVRDALAEVDALHGWCVTASGTGVTVTHHRRNRHEPPA